MWFIRHRIACIVQTEPGSPPSPPEVTFYQHCGAESTKWSHLPYGLLEKFLPGEVSKVGLRGKHNTSPQGFPCWHMDCWGAEGIEDPAHSGKGAYLALDGLKKFTAHSTPGGAVIRSFCDPSSGGWGRVADV